MNSKDYFTEQSSEISSESLNDDFYPVEISESLNESNEKDKEEQKEINEPYWTLYKSFVNVPKVHFVYESLLFVVFLLLFSYYLLCDLNFDEKEIPYTEYALIFCILMFSLEEINQVKYIFFIIYIKELF